MSAFYYNFSLNKHLDFVPKFCFVILTYQLTLYIGSELAGA